MSEYKFVIRTDDKDVSEADAIEQGLAVIWAAIHINILHFKKNPHDICALACGKVKYDTGNSKKLSMVGPVSTVPILIKEGIGLCIDIVAFDVAAKIFEGQDAWPHIFSRGNGFFHVVTQGRSRDGSVIQYDPSAELEAQGLVTTNQPDSCRSCRM